MKKILLSVLLAVVMCFAFVGCSTEGSAPTTPETPGIDSGNPADEGYTVTFACDANVTVYVYKTQDMSGAGEAATTAYSRDSATGALLKDGNGQVNFKLVFASGYELDNISVVGTYNNLKGSNDTGVENGYRITKIESELTVTVTSKQEGEAEDLTQGYEVTFSCGEHVSVVVYRTQDMSEGGEATNTAYSREGGTGTLTKGGDGQVNFVLVFDEGYELDNIVVSGTYKNIKYPVETGVENGYRITKIESELTVTVTSKQEGAAEDLTQGYEVTFVCGEHVSVVVYRTQDMSGEGENTSTAYSRDGGNGALTKTDGQVNFVLVFDDGYELDSIEITEGYKNLKDPADPEVANSYRITKITDNLTVTVTAKQSA